jgi:hypothetical protein
MAYILVRDTNGNTLFETNANDVPLGVQDVDPIDVHWSDTNSIIVTVDVES